MSAGPYLRKTCAGRRGAAPRQRQGRRRVVGVVDVQGRDVKSPAPRRGKAPDLRAEGRFIGRLLGAAMRGGSRYRLAALTARELAVCGMLPCLARDGTISLDDRPGIAAPAPGAAVWRAFDAYRRELAGLLRAGRCPFCAGSLRRLRHMPGARARRTRCA